MSALFNFIKPLFNAVKGWFIPLSIIVILGAVITGVNKGYKELKTSYYNEGVRVTEEKYEKMLEEVRLEQERKEKLLQEKVTELENTITQNQIEYQKQYELAKEEVQREADRIIERLQSDVNRLSIEVRTSREEASDLGSSPRTVSAPNTYRRAALSERSARFLIGQAARADQTLLALNLCKQVLHETREVVDKYNKALVETNKK